MVTPTFRERWAKRDGVILQRVGDRATREDGTDVLGTFENPFKDRQLGAKGGSPGVAMGIDASAVREPRFNVPVADAIGLDKGSVLTIQLSPAEGGGLYTVTRREPDGDGWVALVLQVKHERTADIR